MKIDHFLITRFNIAMPHKKDKHNRPTLTKEWLDNRFELFETYCLPSIKQQTNRDFKWLCLFDADTPEEYKQRIEGYEKILDNIVVCYLTEEKTEGETLYSALKELIKPYLSSDAEIVVTTRVDNDDALNKEMMEQIRLHVLKGNSSGKILSFYYGYQYVVKLNMIVKRRSVNNHYLSLVEPAAKFETVMKFMHNKAAEYAPIEKVGVDKRVYWLEVIHEKNLMNHMVASLDTSVQLRRLSLAEFGLNKTLSVRKALPGFFKEYLPKYFISVAYRIKKSVERKLK